MIEVTLRDYFAGQAMQKLIVGFPQPSEYPRIVRKAYEIADAMIKEKNKPSAQK